jgi:hypothetical protein
MAYLDAQPMVLAFRRAPYEFREEGEWVRHIPSKHDFLFEPSGGIMLRAHCNCANLRVAPDKVGELRDAYQSWRSAYWVPLTINRDFAEHFHTSLWRRALLRMTDGLQRWLLKPRHAEEGPERIGQLAPAE